MDVQKLSEKDFDNMIWYLFEEVSKNAEQAQGRMEKLRGGTASDAGMSADEVLNRYKEKLQVTITVIDGLLADCKDHLTV